MTDRQAGYVVVLDRDIREDDAESILTALRMIKGVIAVTPVQADTGSQIAAMRRDNEWRTALHQLVVDGPASDVPHP